MYLPCWCEQCIENELGRIVAKSINFFDFIGRFGGRALLLSYRLSQVRASPKIERGVSTSISSPTLSASRSHPFETMSAAATPVCSSQKAKKAQKVKKDVFAEADDSELWEIVDRFSHDFGFTQTTKAKKASSKSSASSAIAVPVTPPRPLTKLEIIKRALDIDNEHRADLAAECIEIGDVKANVLTGDR